MWIFWRRFSPSFFPSRREWYRQKEIDRWISGVFSGYSANGKRHPRRSNEGCGREIPRRTFSHGRPASLFTNKKGLSSPSSFSLPPLLRPPSTSLRVPLGLPSLCLSALRSSRTPPPAAFFSLSRAPLLTPSPPRRAKRGRGVSPCRSSPPSPTTGATVEI